MNNEFRTPQTIAGEQYPRNFFIGLEACRTLSEAVHSLAKIGIDLMAIPETAILEKGILAENLDKGMILGCAMPILPEKDEIQIITWDGYGVTSLSILMYLHKATNDWKGPGDEGYQKPHLHTNPKLVSSETKHPKHPKHPTKIKNPEHRHSQHPTRF